VGSRPSKNGGDNGELRLYSVIIQKRRTKDGEMRLAETRKPQHAELNSTA
jgi:hypothetical protein